jgi:ABC-type branched-subunit amino acid transport system ATPase component
MSEREPAMLEFLPRQQDRMLAVLASLRHDVNVLTPIVQRLEEMEIAATADRRVSELPYGKRRLLEIAIALSPRPRVLLLDEPATGVPSRETEVIHQALDGF